MRPCSSTFHQEAAAKFAELSQEALQEYQHRSDSSVGAARLGRRLVQAGRKPEIAEGHHEVDAIADGSHAADEIVTLEPNVLPAPQDLEVGAILLLESTIFPHPQELALDCFCGVEVPTELKLFDDKALCILAESPVRLPNGECSPLHSVFLCDYFRNDKRKGSGYFGDDSPAFQRWGQ